MAVLTVPIPVDFISSMNRLIGEMKRFADIAKTMKVEMPTNIQNMRSAQSSVNSRFKNLDRLFKKVEETFSRSITKIISMMGSFGKGFIVSFRFMALGPIIGTILTAGSLIWTGIKYGLTAGTFLARWVFNKIVELGDNMLQDFLQSSGVLTSIGGLRAFRSAFAGFDTPGLLSNVAEGRLSGGSKQYAALNALRVLHFKDTVEMATQATIAAAEFMKAQPLSLALPMADAALLTALFSPKDLIMLRYADMDELRMRARLVEEYREKMRLSNKAILGWTKFSRIYKSMWERIRAVIAEELANEHSPFVKSVKELSEAAVKFMKTFSQFISNKENIETISKFLETLNNQIGKPEFRDVILTIIKDVSEIVQLTWRCIQALSALGDKSLATHRGFSIYDSRGARAITGAVAGAPVGAPVAPPAGAPAAPGAPAAGPPQSFRQPFRPSVPLTGPRAPISPQPRPITPPAAPVQPPVTAPAAPAAPAAPVAPAPAPQGPQAPTTTPAPTPSPREPTTQAPAAPAPVGPATAPTHAPPGRGGFQQQAGLPKPSYAGGAPQLSPSQMRVLDTVAHGEVNRPWDGDQRSGYGETVSNQHFDPNAFPNQHPYESGQFRRFYGRPGTPSHTVGSTASGRYQETLTTYRENVRRYGVAGFSQAAQDYRAYRRAQDLYRSSGAWRTYPGATGNLTRDVRRFGNDPNWWSNAAAPGLKNEWTSVPGGIEPNQRTRTWVQTGVNGPNRTGPPPTPQQPSSPFQRPSQVFGNQPPSPSAPSSVPPAQPRPNPAQAPSPGQRGRGWTDLEEAPGHTYNVRSVDPQLREVISAGRAQFLARNPGYDIKGVSGSRRGGGFHGQNAAIDVMIYGPDGKPIDNRGSDPTGKYRELARLTYGEALARYPERARNFSWGGAHGTQRPSGGPPDLMHFDFGGSRGQYTYNNIHNLGPIPGVNYGRPVTSPQYAQPPSQSPAVDSFGQPAVVHGAPTAQAPSEKESHIAAIAANSTPLTQLGLKSSKITTFKELEESGKATELQKKEMAEDYGFTMLRNPSEIYYRANYPGALPTLAHEAGHAGVAEVKKTAATEPNIFRRYGLNVPMTGFQGQQSNPRQPPSQRLVVPDPEEHRQRYYDIQDLDRQLAAGLITKEQHTREMNALRHYTSHLSPENIAEINRHHAMYEKRAKDLLSQPPRDYTKDPRPIPAGARFNPYTGEPLTHQKVDVHNLSDHDVTVTHSHDHRARHDDEGSRHAAKKTAEKAKEAVEPKKDKVSDDASFEAVP